MPLRVNKGITIWSPPAPEPITEGLGEIRDVTPPFVPLLPARAAQSHILQVPMIEQTEKNWCWAACIQMIMAFFNHNLGQCSVAGLLFENRDCCANRSSCNVSCAPE